MSTATLQRPAIVQGAQAQVFYNKYAYISLVLALIFVAYLLFPRPTLLRSIDNLSVLFVLVVPLAALVLSIISIKRSSFAPGKEKGTVLGYVALGVTSLYFMTALAIPFVLIGCYLLYTYVI